MSYLNSESDSVECDFCGRCVQQNENAKHISSEECSGKCEFVCSLQVDGEALRDHYVTCLAHHLADGKRLANAIASHQANVSQQGTLRGLHTNLRELDDVDLNGLLIKLKMRCDGVSSSMQSRFSDLQQTMENKCVTVDDFSKQEAHLKATFDHIQHCCEQLSKHVSGNAALENDGDKTNEDTKRNAVQSARLEKDISAMELNVSKLVESLFANDLELAKVERTVRWLDCTSFDGCFVWKVQNVSARFESARSCTSSDALATSIWSPSFYTSPDGYRLRLRLFLNGTGQSFGRFVSLFVVIVAGDYDALLEWPFARSVSLQLLDQQASMTSRTNVSEAEELELCSAEPQHITAYVRPRTELVEALLRPIDLNDGFGVEQFAPVSLIAAPAESEKGETSMRKRRPIYVQNDEMFFRAIVDPLNVFI